MKSSYIPICSIIDYSAGALEPDMRRKKARKLRYKKKGWLKKTCPEYGKWR